MKQDTHIRTVHRVLARELTAEEIMAVSGADGGDQQVEPGTTLDTIRPNNEIVTDGDAGGTWKWKF